MNDNNKIILYSGITLASVGVISLLFGKNILAMFNMYVIENKEAFMTKVNEIASKLGIKSEWLMAVMAFESGLNHKAVNKTSGATGLIQFMPSTATGLGTSTSALAAMTNVQQLDYVYKYLAPYKSKMTSLAHVYLSVFYPAAVGKADTYVIGAVGSKIAQQNPALRDSSGAVTVGSVKTMLANWLTKKGITII
jgi:hypothetical protein